MTRQKWTIGLVAAAFSISLAPAVSAQDTRGGQAVGSAGSRPSSGDTTGSATARGGDSGGSSMGSSSSSGSSAGSMGSSAGTGSSSSGGFSRMGGAPREAAPQRPSYGGDRRGGGTGERATPRGSSAASGGDSVRGAGSGSSMYYGGEGARDRTPIPAYSRPRDGRTVTGTAGDRGSVPPTGGGGSCGRGCDTGWYPIYDPYYYYGYWDPYWYGYGYRYSNYWMPGYGFGFGYFGYDPFLFGGYYDPYAAAASGQATGGYGVGTYKGVGALRLKVKPTNAQVYIDGYYVGLVDAFDGMFQKLEIEAGSHRVEVRAEGFEPVQFDVIVAPGETITYKGELPRIK